MDCSTPGFPVHHQLPEFTQTHVHWVSDGIQPSHPLSSLSPPAFNLPQHPMSQFFTWGGQSIGILASASVILINIQDWFPLGWTGLLKSIESVMPSSHLILCRPLLLPLSIFPSIWVFSIESVLRIRWPKDWSFSFSISPSNKYSGLISFRMDWLDLLAVQGTLKSLL